MITITRESGDRYAVKVRGHDLVTDQPTAAGGDDAGPTPTELFVAGLAACVAFYAGRFLRRHVDSSVPLSVSCSFEMSVDPPSRVTAVHLVVDVPTALDDDVRAAMLRAAEHCTVHNSLRTPADVRIAVCDTSLAATVG